jgi:hypothetical protein
LKYHDDLLANLPRQKDWLAMRQVLLIIKKRPPIVTFLQDAETSEKSTFATAALTDDR